jgi:hypothetical protein
MHIWHICCSHLLHVLHNVSTSGSKLEQANLSWVIRISNSPIHWYLVMFGNNAGWEVTNAPVRFSFATLRTVLGVPGTNCSVHGTQDESTLHTADSHSVKKGKFWYIETWNYQYSTIRHREFASAVVSGVLTWSTQICHISASTLPITIRRRYVSILRARLFNFRTYIHFHTIASNIIVLASRVLEVLEVVVNSTRQKWLTRSCGWSGQTSWRSAFVFLAF